MFCFMEKFTLAEDIKVFCVTADSFPEGIEAAHQKLHSLIPLNKERRTFGISRPGKDGPIVYKAAVEELEPGEGEKLGLESFTIKKGVFACETLVDYYKDIPNVGVVFRKLLEEPELDPNGYCLEWYLSGKDVRCMVPLK